MLKKNKRWIQFTELHLKRSPEHAPAIALASLLDGWKARIDAGDAAKVLDNGLAAIRIKKAKLLPKQQALVLLVQYVNTDVAAPSIGSLDSDIVKHDVLLDREGIAVAAHVVLSTQPKEEMVSVPRYLCLIEEVPGVGRSVLRPFLRSELKNLTSTRTFCDPSDGHQGKPCYLASELEQLADTTLAKEVERGSKITNVEFFTTRIKDRGIDETPSLELSKQVLVMKAVPGNSQGEIISDIRRMILPMRKLGYDELKFRYKHPAGKQKTGALGMNEEDLADALLGRSLEISTDESLKQCHDDIVRTLASQMVSELLRTRGA